jgi:hypothetical protein
MSQLEVERFLGRLMTDAGFRADSAISLESACFKEGIVLSKVEESLLSRLDFSRFGLFAEILDDSIRRR